MQTIEVPRQNWGRTLDEFTAVHEGWLVSLDVLRSDIGVQPEIVDLPLLGISADRAGDGSTITISAARSPTEHITHAVQGAYRLYIDRADDGADSGLQIESADGARAILRFRIAALPATVDGEIRPRWPKKLH